MRKFTTSTNIHSYFYNNSDLIRFFSCLLYFMNIQKAQNPTFLTQQILSYPK